jgi:hypothetical protein
MIASPLLVMVSAYPERCNLTATRSRSWAVMARQTVGGIVVWRRTGRPS